MEYFLTKEKYEELKNELEHLQKEGRIDIADRLKKAKDYGDLSENAEYQLAKGRLRGINNAILRLDFNSEGDWRLKRSLPTLKFLQKHAAKIVILSHKGRPTPSLLPLKENAKFSLKKDANKLSKFLNYPVNFINCSRISEAGNEIRNSKENSVFVLENVRFLEGEAENNLSLSEHLASLGDYFVNDAFAVSHRANASVVGITKFLPSYAGFEMEEELKNLSHIMEKPAHPFVMVFGGGKATDKLPIILNFRNKADFFLLGGALANTMLYLKGEKMGNSLIEKEIDGALPNLLKMKNVVLPFDFRKKGKAILDIGPKTEKLFSSYIKKAKTIVWNGPLGAFEKKGFEFRKHRCLLVSSAGVVSHNPARTCSLCIG